MPALVVDVPGRTTATSLDVEELLRTRSTLSLPATAGCLDRGVGAASGGRMPVDAPETTRGLAGAAVGFGLGVRLSCASDQKGFGGESTKEHLSDGVNGVFD